MVFIKKLRKILNGDIKKYYIQEQDADTKQYLEVVSHYIEYYHYRAWSCKWWFYGLNTLKILSLASIVVINAIESEVDMSAYAVIASAICLIIEGVIALYHFQEKWILYRNTNNILMSEIRFFATSKGEYQDKQKAFNLFVERVESIIGDEARKWNETVREKNKEESDKSLKEED